FLHQFAYWRNCNDAYPHLCEKSKVWRKTARQPNRLVGNCVSCRGGRFITVCLGTWPGRRLVFQQHDSWVYRLMWCLHLSVYLEGTDIQESNCRTSGLKEQQFARRNGSFFHPRFSALWVYIYHTALYPELPGMDGLSSWTADGTVLTDDRVYDANHRTG